MDLRPESASLPQALPSQCIAYRREQLTTHRRDGGASCWRSKDLPCPSCCRETLCELRPTASRAQLGGRSRLHSRASGWLWVNDKWNGIAKRHPSAKATGNTAARGHPRITWACPAHMAHFFVWLRLKSDSIGTGFRLSRLTSRIHKRGRNVS